MDYFSLYRKIMYEETKIDYRINFYVLRMSWKSTSTNFIFMLLGIRPVFKCILFWWKCIRIIFALFLQKLYSYKCFVGHKLSLFGMVLRLLLSDEIVLKVRHFLCCIMIFVVFKYLMCTEFKLFLFIFFQMHNCMVKMNFPRYSNCIFHIILFEN